MEDAFLVHMRECGEEAAKVYLAIIDRHLPEILSKICMLEVWEDSDDLVGTANGCDKGSDCFAVPQVFEEVEFIEDTGGGGCDVDLLDGNNLWTAAALQWKTVLAWCCPTGALKALSLVDVPGVIVFIVHEVFGFVHSGECA